MTVSVAIPAARPVVLDSPCVGEASGMYEALCFVPECLWSYGPSVKTEVKRQATIHRQSHRDAHAAAVSS